MLEATLSVAYFSDDRLVYIEKSRISSKSCIARKFIPYEFEKQNILVSFVVCTKENRKFRSLEMSLFS